MPQNLEKKLESMLNYTVPVIKTEELKKIDKSVVLLDTRSREEYQTSHIEGATFINYKDFSAEMMEGIDKEDTVVVYCSVGYRSEKIGEQLQKLGYKNVKNLYGGIFDWKNKGNEVINETGKTDSVHTYNRLWSQYLTNGVKVY